LNVSFQNQRSMENAQIIEKLEQAIAQLLEHELNILQRGLNELNLNGHLVRYLHPLFPGYQVEAEYNGDIFKVKDRKEIEIAKRRMQDIGLDPSDSNAYNLTPDIIIHIRNSNEHNILILEIKKDSNAARNKAFDLLKLEHMTIDYQGNHYNYQLGAAIIFGTGDNAGTHEIGYFYQGISKDKAQLI